MTARTVCCHALVDTKKTPSAKTKYGEFLVCNDNCKDFVQMATKDQMDKIMK